eukprot:1162099-Pelagomonas_calceolata.AAC.1
MQNCAHLSMKKHCAGNLGRAGSGRHRIVFCESPLRMFNEQALIPSFNTYFGDYHGHSHP